MSTLNLTNNFGETTSNEVLESSDPFPPLSPAAAGTVVANIEETEESPVYVPLADFAEALPNKEMETETVLANITGETAVGINVTLADFVEALPNKVIAAESLIVNLDDEAAAGTEVTFQELSDIVPAKTGVEALVAIATADVPAAAVGYVQADVEEMVVLINELKAAYNGLLAALKVVA